MKKMLLKRLSCSALMLILIVSLFSFNIAAEDSMTDDEFLLAHGVPLDVLSQLSTGQKNHIRSDLDPSATFSYFSHTDNTFSDAAPISARGIGTIPSSSFSMNVVGFEIFVNNQSMYSVYPTYTLSTPNLFAYTITNDALVISAYPGWEIAPSSPNLRLYRNPATIPPTDYVDYSPYNSTAYGYEFRITNFITATSAVEGHAALRVRATTSNPTYAVNIRYIKCAGNTTNYSVNIAQGSSSIVVTSGSDSDISTIVNNYSFN